MLVLETEWHESQSIGAEGVGRDDVRTRSHVCAVNVLDQVGAEVDLVVAAVDEHATLVDLGAHRTVEGMTRSASASLKSISSSALVLADS